MRTATVSLAATLFLFSTDCQATRDISAALVRGVVNGLLDGDESFAERQQREDRDRFWKAYWANNPHENPAMTEAFAGE